MARPGVRRGQVGEGLTGSAARELAVLVDGPWAPRWYWRDELEAMQRAARRYPAGHPSAVLSCYRPTTEFRIHPTTPETNGRAWRYQLIPEPDGRAGSRRGTGADSMSTAGGTSITERLVGALSTAWRAIQERHPEVPDVVLTLGSGTAGARRGEITLGHFAAGRWHTTTNQATLSTTGEDEPDCEPIAGLAELFVGGEGLRRGARGVLGTLLHEAAHGLAATRGIADTSRQGRYHNRRFATLGKELGITVEPDGARGWSATSLPDTTAADYASELITLAEAITAYRRAEVTGPGKPTSRNNPPATCGCEPARRIRVARAVLAAGPIECGVCGHEFTTTDAGGGGETDEEQADEREGQ